MSESERVERAAELLERLLVDADFRARFRAQPEAACREAGLHDLADEIALGGGALQTLEVRESRSSLLGVMMAAALEGMGVIELSHLAGTGLTGEAAHVANIASSRAGGPRLHGPHVPHVAAPHLPHAPRVPAAPHLPHAPHVPQAPAAGAAAAAAQSPPGAGAQPPAGAGPAGAAPGAGPAGAAGAPAAAAAAVPAAGAGAAAADPAAAAGGPPAAGAGAPASAPAGPPPGPPGALSGVPAASADSGWPDAPGAPAGADQAGWGQAAAGGGQDAAGWPAAGGGPQAAAAGAVADPSAAAAGAGAGPALDPSAAGAGAAAGPALDPSAAPGVPAPAAAAAVAAAPVGTDAGGALQQLVDQHRLDLPPGMQPAAFAGTADPRLLSALETLAGGHRLGLKVIDGQGIDITTVDGLPVGPDNPGARDLMSEIAALDPSQRPTRVGGPWAVSAPGFFSDPAHQDHINLGFEGAARGTIQFSAVADPSQQAGTPSAPAGAAAQAAPSAPAGGVVDAGQPPAGAAAVIDAAPAGGGGGFDLSSAAHDYPGDHASKAQIAHWMGEWAQRAGLPRELPVMASLVEGGMSNVQYGDADSLGYFQMRTSIWSGQYPDFQHHPEQQLKWFIDHALEVKKQRLGQGQSAFEHDPNQWGNWIADIERPAAQYRGRYQLRLAEARSLLGSAGAPAGSGQPVAAAASAAPQPIQPPAQPIQPPAQLPATPAQPAQVPVTPAAPDGVAASAPGAPAQGSGPPGTISFTAAPQGGAAPGAPAAAGQGAPGAPAVPGQAVDQAAAGAVPGAPAAGPQLVAGQDITVPGTASNELRQIFERAAILDHRRLPYLWGGGHQGGVGNVVTTGPVDCSGAVSEVLGLDPRVSGAYENWGLPGPGKSVTVYANAEHVLMEINGHFFGTSAANPGGGAGWIPREHIPPSYLAAFVARHPPGL